MELSPGDPARNILGTNASPQEVEALREEMGLNDAFLVRYGRFVKDVVVHGDLGESYITKTPVVEEIASRAGYTFKLRYTYRDYLGSQAIFNI